MIKSKTSLLVMLLSHCLSQDADFVAEEDRIGAELQAKLDVLGLNPYILISFLSKAKGLRGHSSLCVVYFNILDAKL